MEWISSPEAWIALLTLTVLETVLGIDNIIFVAIIAERVQEKSRAKARQLGLTLAVATRILLLFSIVWIMRLTEQLFEVFGHGVSGRDLILLTGGLFLLYKATHEIHHKLEGEAPDTSTSGGASSFASVIAQILVLDIVFSIDSVVTAVGLADDLAVMVIAVLVSGLIMIISANPISLFVEAHPTVRMLALAFLLLIGMALVAEGMGQHIPKGYVYFAMGFSVLVEVLNLKARSRKGPVLLRRPMTVDPSKT